MPEADALARGEAETISLFQNPPRDLDEAAVLFAQKGTFTADLPPALKNLQETFNHPALKIVVPFFKTPANIGLQVIERTPFAPLSSQWREELAKQLILERLGETVEVTELARACALSRSHFSRAFKCSTGLSPQDWIRHQRIARAKQLIQNTDMTLTQISLECGFCDQAHFTREFKRAFGTTPKVWRERYLGK